MVIIVCHCIIYKGGSECNLLLLLLLDTTHTLHKFSVTDDNDSACATCIIFWYYKVPTNFLPAYHLFADEMPVYENFLSFQVLAVFQRSNLTLFVAVYGNFVRFLQVERMLKSSGESSGMQ